MSAQIEFRDDIKQGSDEWLALRKTKITATDAAVIMGISPWKSITQLYYEKMPGFLPTKPNEWMRRGTELEPIARDLFNAKTEMTFKMIPKVAIRDWAMASLDGISVCNVILEIKCPGPKDHSLALQGKIPEYYYPQLQHQMYVCDSQKNYYFSFDGVDGVIVEIKRDDEYIEKMVKQEIKFYECMKNKTPPDPSENDFIERDDDLWKQCAMRWKYLSQSIKTLEKEEDEIRSQLIFLAGDFNAKGAGISLCKINRKGNIDYTKIPELKGLNLETYRKPESVNWRIT